MALAVPPFLSHLRRYIPAQIAGYVLNQNPEIGYMGVGEIPKEDPNHITVYTPGSVADVVVKPFSRTSITLTLRVSDQRTILPNFTLSREGVHLRNLPSQTKDYPFIIFDVETREWCIGTPQFARFIHALHTGQCIGKKSLLHGILGSKMTVVDKDFPNTFAISKDSLIEELQGWMFARYTFVYLALRLWYPDYLTLFIPNDYVLVDTHVREWFGDIICYNPIPETRFVQEATKLLHEIL